MKYIIPMVIAIILIFLFVLSYIPIGIEPLTEAYFENHTKLPANLFLNKSYNFSFTVHNLEYMNMTYSYNVDMSYGNKTQNIDNGSIFLGNNETASIFEEFRINEHFKRASINILILKMNENPMQKDPNLKNRTIDLHFWADEITGPTITIIPD